MDVVRMPAAIALLLAAAGSAGAAAAVPPTAAASSAPTIRAGVEKWRAGDYPGAVAMWQPFATAGDADAMFNMGQAYKLGRGVAPDAAVARDYYRRAATKGHLPAQANLGIALFQAGEKPEAIKWLRIAADRGEARAQYVLGIAAFNGDGLPRSQALGYGYLLRAQASGLPQAATALGSITAALSPADRSAGEAVSASIAAGTGVPAALAAATAPRLLASSSPIKGVPTTLDQSLPIRTPPSGAMTPTTTPSGQTLPIRTPPTPAPVMLAVKPVPTTATPVVTPPKPVMTPPPVVQTVIVAKPIATPPPVTQTVVVAKPVPASIKAPPTPPVEVATIPARPTVVVPAPAPIAAANPPAVVPPSVMSSAVRSPATIATTEVPASKPVDPMTTKTVVVAKPAPAKPVAVAKAEVPLKPFETVVTPAAKKPDGWKVQLGAFSQRKLAEAAWADVKSTAAPAKPIYNSDGPVVKLQMGPFASRDAARAACAKLTEAGRSCFVTSG